MRPAHLFLLCTLLTMTGCELLAEPPATTTEITFSGEGDTAVFDTLGEAKAYLVTNEEGGVYITEFRIRWEDFGEDGADLDLAIAHEDPTLADGTYEVHDYSMPSYDAAIESRKLYGQLFINDSGTFHEIHTLGGTFTVTDNGDGKTVAFDATLEHEIVESEVVDDLGKVEETRTEQPPVTLDMTIDFPDASAFQGRL